MFLSMMVFSQNRMDGCFCISHIAHVFGAKKHPLSKPQTIFYRSVRNYPDPLPAETHEIEPPP